MSLRDDDVAAVKAFNSRLGAVTLNPESLKPHEPQDAIEKVLVSVLPAPRPRSAFSVRVEGENFHADAMRNNIRRGIFAISTGEAKLIRLLHRIALWKEPRVTAAYAVIYWTLWYGDVIAASIIGVVLLRLLRPTIFSAPIFGPFKLQGDPSAPMEVAEGVSTEVEDALIEKAATEPAASATETPPGSPTVGQKDVQGSPGKAVVPASPKASKPGIQSKIAQYGLPAQRALGNWADMHERFANLFNGRGTPDSARYRWAAILSGLILLLAFVPIRLLIRGGTFGCGIHFFAIVALAHRYPPLHDLLDAENLLRDMPTNAQLAIVTLRANPELIQTLGKPEPRVDPMAKTTSKEKFASLVRFGMSVTEKGSEYFSREPPPEDGNTAHSFFAAYGVQLGHLMIHPRKGDQPARLVFKTGVTIAGRQRKEVLSLPLSSIVRITKTNYANFAGLGLSQLGMDGVGEGMEIVDKDGTTHAFNRCYRRDQAFCRILVAEDLPWQLA